MTDGAGFGIIELFNMCVFSGRKGASDMGTEAERQDTRKAMAYDLVGILEAKPEQTSYTVEEIKKMIRTYITTAEQK